MAGTLSWTGAERNANCCKTAAGIVVEVVDVASFVEVGDVAALGFGVGLGRGVLDAAAGPGSGCS